MDQVARDIIWDGADAEIGLISKLTAVLEGDDDTLGNLETEEREVLQQQLKMIKELKE